MLIWLLACQAGGEGTVPDGDDGSSVDDPAGDDDDDDTGDPPVVDVAPELSAFTAALHPTLGTLIYAGWTQSAEADVHVEFTFEDDIWLSSPVRTFLAGSHEELLLGIPHDMDVTWRIVAENSAGTATSPDQVLRTRELPDSVPPFEIHTDDVANQDPDTKYVYVSVTAEGDDFGDRWWVLIIDRKGRPVWAVQSRSGAMSMHPRLSWDKTGLLVDQNLWWSQFNREAGSIDKVRIDGTLVHTWDTPGLHHPYQEMPDNSLAWGAWTGSYDEALMRVYMDGTVETVWDCDQFLLDIGVDESCASNTLNYDALTDRFLYSFFTFESVIEIDASTGEAVRWFGNIPGSYDFDPPNSTFFYQHGAYYTDTGTLLLSAHASPFSDELVIREYEVDEANETLHEVFNFGLGLGITGADMGQADRLVNGNTLHNHGSNPRLREVTPAGEVVWDIQWDTDTVGRSTPLAELYALAPPPN